MLLAVILARESPGVRLRPKPETSPALKHLRKSKQIKK